MELYDLLNTFSVSCWLTQHCVILIHANVWGHYSLSLFYGVVLMHLPQLLTSLSDGHLSCFHCLAVSNYFAINILVVVS